MTLWQRFCAMLGYGSEDSEETKESAWDDKDAENSEAGTKERIIERSERTRRKEEKNMDDKSMPQKNTEPLNFVLVKPEKYDDAGGIADNLINNRPVVLNLEGTEQSISRRLLDFLAGVAYAVDGRTTRVANATFVITPRNIRFVGEIADELEIGGVFFSTDDK